MLGKTDWLSGLTLKWTLSKHLKPGNYAIGLACADGSLAAKTRVLRVTAAKKHHRRRHR